VLGAGFRAMRMPRYIEISERALSLNAKANRIFSKIRYLIFLLQKSQSMDSQHDLFRLWFEIDKRPKIAFRVLSKYGPRIPDSQLFGVQSTRSGLRTLLSLLLNRSIANELEELLWFKRNESACSRRELTRASCGSRFTTGLFSFFILSSLLLS